jgi:hypothetical protein
MNVYLGSRLVNSVELVVEDVPLRIDDLLVLFNVVNANFGVVLLGLKFLKKIMRQLYENNVN